MLKGLFLAAKREAHGYTNFNALRTVIFLIACSSILKILMYMPFNLLEIQNSRKLALVDDQFIHRPMHNAELASNVAK